MAENMRIFTEKIWIPSESPFRFAEAINPQTGSKKFIMEGLLLPFGKISRNNVLYNVESIREKHKQLIGRPVMYNHKVDTDMMPKGHFIESWLEDDGWHYKADIDPREEELIGKLKREDLRHVSIQLLGGKVIERLEESTGRTFTEAWVSDIIEGSIVPAPGFLDTTAKFAEALGSPPGTNINLEQMDVPFKIGDKIIDAQGRRGDVTGFSANAAKVKWEDGSESEAPYGELRPVAAVAECKEDVTTTTGGGAMAPTKIVGKKDTESFKEALSTLKHGDDPDDKFDPSQLAAGAEVETEHTDDKDLAKQIAKAHLAEFPDYYTHLAKMEDELKASKITSEIPPAEALAEMMRFREQKTVKKAETKLGVLSIEEYEGFGYIVKLGSAFWTFAYPTATDAETVYSKILEDAKRGTVRSPFSYH